MLEHHCETVEWKKALRDVGGLGGLREFIARAFRDLGMLELSPTDRLVIRTEIEAMTADLKSQLEMFTGIEAALAARLSEPDHVEQSSQLAIGMTEPAPNDFGTIVLSICFCLVVASTVGAILSYSFLIH